MNLTSFFLAAGPLRSHRTLTEGESPRKRFVARFLYDKGVAYFDGANWHFFAVGQPAIERALRDAGFSVDHVPAEWEDVGGPENGPKLVGHDDYDHWYRDEESNNSSVSVIVQEGAVVDVMLDPLGPPTA